MAESLKLYAARISEVEEIPDARKLKKEIRAAFAHVERVRARARKTQAEIDKLKEETRTLIKEMQAA